MQAGFGVIHANNRFNERTQPPVQGLTGFLSRTRRGLSRDNLGYGLPLSCRQQEVHSSSARAPLNAPARPAFCRTHRKSAHPPAADETFRPAMGLPVIAPATARRPIACLTCLRKGRGL